MQQGQTHEAMPHHEWPCRPLLICEGQELDSQLTHHVAVERYKVGDPKAVKNREQQISDGRRQRPALLGSVCCSMAHV
jgi:hypothetical protein